MDRSSTTTLSIAVVMLLVAIASPFVFPAVFASEDDIFGFVWGLCGFFVFFIVGLVVLIVGLSRGNAQRQQQQQQVVVMGAGGMPVPGSTTVTTRVRCPSCQHLNPVQARFCTQCATHLGGAAP